MAKRAVVAVAAACLMGVTLLPVLAAVAAGGTAGAPSGGDTSDGTGRPGPARGPAIPPAWVDLEQRAATTCPGLPWSVLGAVGTVESESGQSSAPGVSSGANAAGAEGPFQFEPATFDAYATVGPGGAVPPSPYDLVDAAYTAAAMLCANGGGSPATLRDALLAYDHSAAYAQSVLALSVAFAADDSLSAAGAAAIAYAARQIGLPYVWGGAGPSGFDCSGLVQAAYATAGVTLPRVAQDQFDAGPAAPAADPFEPGDLVFFGSGPSAVSHVGLVLAPGVMIDAPHTGALVRAETFPAAVGAAWGTEDVVGSTRPDG
ncbi:MAG TPA: NlpC/P60 family protein [Acidimicrobiales bacterium]|nr:NlpC/P60 family protein [Acidimicrobiales bacterium]